MNSQTVKKLAVLCVFVSILLTIQFSLLLKTFFSYHMALHMVLAYALAPSLLAAGLFVWLFPIGWQNRISDNVRSHKRIFVFLTNPIVGFVLSTFAMWVIHYPFVYDYAMGNDIFHGVAHVGLVLAFIFYWAPFFRSAYGLSSLETNESRVLYLLAGVMVSGLLGALITFSNSVLYGHYFIMQEMGPISLVDQQVGGAIMWIAGCFAYLAAVFFSLETSRH